MKKKYAFFINEFLQDKRLDVAITERFSFITRSSLKNNIETLSVNKKNQKLSYKCKLGEEIFFEYDEPQTLENEDIKPEKIDLNIIYQDQNYLVINKPYGMVVHPAKGNFSGTLVNALLGLNTDLSDVDKFRPGIVHRIDKETSGLIIIAKNNKSHVFLQDLFKNREITKKYKAIVKGYFNEPSILIQNNIGRDPNNRLKMAVVESGGKYSETNVTVISRNKEFSYLDIDLLTGRTHQIRVHLSDMGYPIIGDKIYSRKSSKYKDAPLCLVSYSLSFFDIFSNKKLEFAIDVPKKMKNILEQTNSGII